MTHDEMIAAITHHKNGGEIEFKPIGNTTWEKTGAPYWNFGSVDYRAKPEPMVIYVEFNSAGKPMNTQLKPYVSTFDRTVIKFVEATE